MPTQVLLDAGGLLALRASIGLCMEWWLLALAWTVTRLCRRENSGKRTPSLPRRETFTG